MDDLTREQFAHVPEAKRRPAPRTNTDLLAEIVALRAMAEVERVRAQRAAQLRERDRWLGRAG